MSLTKKFRKYKRSISLFLTFLFVFEIGGGMVWAVPHGPDSPEMGGFTPVELSDNVSKFSGDFNYNIPLFSIGGYPINIAYSSSGIRNESEATWVGLGWSLNPGAVDRNMRGLPDEFNAEHDYVEQKDRSIPNEKFQLGLSASHFEIVGKDIELTKKWSFGLDVFHSTYTGLGFNLSVGKSRNMTTVIHPDFDKLSASSGLQLQMGSESGLTFVPEKGIQAENKENNVSQSGGGSLSATYNSRSGLQSVKMKANYSKSEPKKYDGKNEFAKKNIKKSMLSFSHASTFSLGKRSFIPNSYLPSKTISYSGSFAIGREVFFTDWGFQINGSYLKEELPGTENNVLTRRLKPYGYMYYREKDHYNKNNAIYDFNSENNVALDDLTPAFNLAFMTYDMFSVNAQGVSGSYRAHRNAITVVSDGRVNKNGDREGSSVSSVNVGFEIAATQTFKGGVNLGVQFTDGHYGGWNQDNLPMFDELTNYSQHVYPNSNLKVPITFKQIGVPAVVDEDLYASLFEEQPFKIPFKNEASTMMVLPLKEYSRLKNKIVPENEFKSINGDYKNIAGNGYYSSIPNTEVQPFSYYTAEEAELLSCQPNMVYYPDGNNQESTTKFIRKGNHRKPNHISEINVTSSNGAKYIFGLPAYNLVHKEASFNLTNGSKGHLVSESDLAKYDEDDDLPAQRGITGYLNEKCYSPYAYAFNITCVLSPDYYDVDGDGPSLNDQGNYVSFEYLNWKSAANPYNWKTPHARQEASNTKAHTFSNLNEGMASSNDDDNGSYVYGAKEIWYAKKIESKEQVAIFHVSESESQQSWSLKGEHEKYDKTDNLGKLDSIQIFSRVEWEKENNNRGDGTPEQTIHFRYNYELAKINSSVWNSGKLTLKRIFNTYRDSKKSAFNGYVFNYGFNPNYAGYNYDRWGMYQDGVANANATNIESRSKSNLEFPFTRQNDRVKADENASAWLLSEIELPTGGKMEVNYEADDYAFVQDKRAAITFPILGFSDGPNNDINNRMYQPYLAGLALSNRNYVFVDINAIHNVSVSGLTADQYWKQAVKGIKKIPVRCLIDITNDEDYEYVKGYVQIEGHGVNANGHGWLKLVPKQISKSSLFSINPISKLALQQARQSFYNKIYKGDVNPSKGFKDLLYSFRGFATDIAMIFRGQERVLLDKLYGREVLPNKSFVVLNDPLSKKIGGGSRVKSIVVKDEWATMAGSGHTGNITGWEYDYTKNASIQGEEMIISSGVAAWEPGLGSIENLNLEPIEYNEKKMLAPTNTYFQLKPYGQFVYPSASVGYSQVTVRNMRPQNLVGDKAKPLGKIVYNFYTAKEFPTKATYTKPDFVKKPSSNFSASALIGKNPLYSGTVSQGFSIVLNDMHGKPTRERHYRNRQESPYRTITYEYQTTSKKNDEGDAIMNLDNRVSVVDIDGTTSDALVGTEFEVTVNTKEFFSVTNSIDLGANIDMTIIGVGFLGIPFFIPTVYVPLSSETTFARSITATKVVSKYGILKAVHTVEDGAKSLERTLAFDKHTHIPFLVENINQYNDPVYQMNYPAYWMYPALGPKSDRDRREVMLNVNNGKIGNAGNLGIRPGDVIYWETSSGHREAHQVYAPNGEEDLELFPLNDAPSQKILLNISSAVKVKVFAHGSKNMMAMNAGTVITKANPLSENGISFYKVPVLSASHQTFKKYDLPIETCVCNFQGNYKEEKLSLLPYYRWFPETNYVLKDFREYTSSNNHQFNLREDGAYSSFVPFWDYSNGQWKSDINNWIYAEKTTAINIFGKPNETEDILNRNNAVYWGFNQSLVKAVTSNAKYKAAFVEDFEMNGSQNCLDKYTDYPLGSVTEDTHTGVGAIQMDGPDEIIINGNVEN
jgi:hypothetical protein